ncbi:MAG: RsmE family RNA methyltransferase [Candidatus Sulfopaludibacter sp.]|nr:RsmE family RNA methyltransferase [Candidatus Sulfopaludibacter sp.]
MARRRFFVPAIHAGAAELRGEEARHLARVLRAEPGQRYEISDNQSVWLAEIAEAHGDRVVFRTVEAVAAVELPVHITLCAALIKFDRFEWLVEKATELGVERIQPVDAARTDKGLFEASRKRSERWVRIARESSQQARRVRVPEILPALRFAAALGVDADHRYFLEEEAAPAFLRVLPAAPAPAAKVALLIGPEGGWTDSERAAASPAGWQAVSLGPQVLRAETATVAALAIVVSAWSR